MIHNSNYSKYGSLIYTILLLHIMPNLYCCLGIKEEVVLALLGLLVDSCRLIFKLTYVDVRMSFGCNH